MLVHQEAGVVTRAIRDYLRDDVAEILIDSEQAYNEAYNFVKAVMPRQLDKLKTYTLNEPLFAHFGIESQIQTAYEREVKLPSGGSIVIDQTEALVSIDINSAKSTRGQDVEDTALNTNLEAAEEIARQLRLRDIGGLVVIDFIDMTKDRNQRMVEAKLREATQSDRARIQFGQLSRFGLMEMSRQRLRPSLEEATGYVCPRCHGTGMVRDLRSLSLSIMRKVEEIALRERHGEVQVEVPVEIAAFLLNEKRHSLVYLEQTSNVRVTVLPHPHLETPHYEISYNPEGFAPTSYERTAATRLSEQELGYEASEWHLEEEQHAQHAAAPAAQHKEQKRPAKAQAAAPAQQAAPAAAAPSASPCAWLENLFVQKQANTVDQSRSANNAAAAIEQMVNNGAVSRGQFGQIAAAAPAAAPASTSNAYLAPSTVAKHERDSAEKPAEREEKSSRHNNKKRSKHKEPREQNNQNDNSPVQHQVHEEVVQLSRQEQRQEARENKRNSRRQHNHNEQTQNEAQQQEAVPRRDRRNQQRPERPNRHRDASVLNDTAAPAAATAAPAAEAQSLKVDLVEAPRQDVMPTALVVNVDAAQSEIVALNQNTVAAPAATAELPVATSTEAVEEAPVPKEDVAPAAIVAEEHKPQPVKRASNDPRQRRRQQREGRAQQNQPPKLSPSQVPALQQYTVGSLIRHVYGEDCSVLIEQFGLIPTFNRALQKFTEQYAASLVAQTPAAESQKQPVTRDVEVSKAEPEAEPAPVLDLTPPAPVKRVANDPRERRRLAKLAAEQAKQAHADEVEKAPANDAPAETAAEPQAAESTTEATAVTSTEAPAEPAATEATPATDTTAEPKVAAEAPAEETVKAEAAEQLVQAELPVDAAPATAEAPEAADKAEKEKPARPRRPRGRPPKKANTSTES